MAKRSRTAHRKPRIALPPGPRKGRDAGTSMVHQRLAGGRALVSSIHHYRAKVASGLAERLACGPGPAGPLPEEALRILDRVALWVEAELAVLVGAHQRYEWQTACCHNLSLDCDRLAREELYPRAVDLRRFIDAAFGKRRGALIHGFQGRTPTWRKGLHHQVRRTLTFLEDPDSELPEPKVPEAVGNRQAWIGLIRPPFEQLEQRLGQLARQSLGREEAGEERRLALASFDVVLSEARAYADATFVLAGLGERARAQLRSDRERRWLRRWAAERRAKRRLEAKDSRAGSDAGREPGSDAPRASVWSGAAAWLAGRLQIGRRRPPERD